MAQGPALSSTVALPSTSQLDELHPTAGTWDQLHTAEPSVQLRWLLLVNGGGQELQLGELGEVRLGWDGVEGERGQRREGREWKVG